MREDPNSTSPRKGGEFQEIPSVAILAQDLPTEAHGEATSSFTSGREAVLGEAEDAGALGVEEAFSEIRTGEGTCTTSDLERERRSISPTPEPRQPDVPDTPLKSQWLSSERGG